MRSQAIVDAIAALSPGFDPRVRWPFREFAQRAGGKVVGAWNDLSRTAMAGMRVGPSGLMGYGPHNLLPYSSDQAQVSLGWTKTGCYPSVGGVLAETTANSQHYTYRGVTLAAGTYTLIARVKPVAGARYVALYPQSASSTDWAIFDLQSGSRLSYGSASGGYIASGIEQLDGGEIRLYITGAASGLFNAVVCLTNSPTVPAPTYAGDSGVVVDFRVVRLIAGLVDAAENDLATATTATARYLPVIEYDPRLGIEGVPYTVSESYGTELSTGSNFTAWVNYPGLTFDTFAASAGALILATATGKTSVAASPTFSVVAGKTYRAVLSITRNAGTFDISIRPSALGASWGGLDSLSASGTYVFYFVAQVSGAAVFRFTSSSVSTLSCTLNSISVQEYLGTVTAGAPRALGMRAEGARTLMSGKANDFADAYWDKTYSAASAVVDKNAAIGPDGLASASRVRRNGSDNCSLFRNLGGIGTLGTRYTSKWVVKYAGSASEVVVVAASAWSGADEARINIQTGTVVSAGANVTVDLKWLPNGWLEINVHEVLTQSTLMYAWLQILGSTQGDSIFVWGHNTASGYPASFAPNITTGTAVIPGDHEGPGVALTGAALTAAFPQGFTRNTVILKFRKRYTSSSLETLWAFSAGSSYGTGNGLLVRMDGTRVEVGGNNATVLSPVGALVLDGSTLNTVVVSWDTSLTTIRMSINGAAEVVLNTLDFTGVDTTHFMVGALQTFGLQALAQSFFDDWYVLPGRYFTGASLQALGA